jgi:uncharacterized protein involved in exopolysaccharide biosynthesis
MTMSTTTQNHSASANEISLKELFAHLWKLKWRLLAVTFASSAVAYAGAKFVTKSYDASTSISPVTTTLGGSSGGALGSIASQFGGLASLAGLSLSGDSRKWESITVLESEALTSKYIEDNNLLPILYAQQWDARTQSWKETDPKKIPTVWKANQYFMKNIRRVVEDLKTGVVRLTIRWKDPKMAAKWANDLVKLTNDYLRDKAIAESERNIAYLNQQATKTEIVGAQQAIYAILQNEINKEMLARGSDEYAFKVLDPAITPEKPSSPQTIIWILVAAFGVAFLSVFVAFVQLIKQKS